MDGAKVGAIDFYRDGFARVREALPSGQHMDRRMNALLKDMPTYPPDVSPKVQLPLVKSAY